jgi:hypothetical protein
MSEIDRPRSVSLTRRALLGACGALPALLATEALATPPKVSQASVAFLETARGDKKCGNCRLFRTPASCLDVAGPISENCSCRIWLPNLA